MRSGERQKADGAGPPVLSWTPPRISLKTLPTKLKPWAFGVGSEEAGSICVRIVGQSWSSAQMHAACVSRMDRLRLYPCWVGTRIGTINRGCSIGLHYRYHLEDRSNPVLHLQDYTYHHMQIARALPGRLEKEMCSRNCADEHEFVASRDGVRALGKREKKVLKRINWYREAEISVAKTYGQQYLCVEAFRIPLHYRLFQQIILCRTMSNNSDPGTIIVLSLQSTNWTSKDVPLK